MGNTKKLFDMGPATSDIFRGNSNSDVIREVYAESATLFADIIKTKLPLVEKPYTLLDIGSSKGELLSEILKFLPDYQFAITATDTNPKAIAENVLRGKKMVVDAESLPFTDNSIDLIIMRYVLQFNSLDAQKKIINEILRVVKRIAIIQHGGAGDVDTEMWREKVDNIFIKDSLPQIKRVGMFWSSAKEIEDFMTKNQIRFERVSSKEIRGLSQVYIERYALNEEQAQELRGMLGDKDYIVRTTWVIYPKN